MINERRVRRCRRRRQSQNSYMVIHFVSRGHSTLPLLPLRIYDELL